MRRFLAEHPDAFQVELNPGLQRLLDSPVAERDGCVLLSAVVPTSTNASIASLGSRTAYECFVNAFHVDRYLDGELEGEALTLQAVALADRLFAKLAARGRIRVIASFNEDDATLRFHRIRPDESWLAHDLEGYLDEALLVLET
jgi:hypothetical protein